MAEIRFGKRSTSGKAKERKEAAPQPSVEESSSLISKAGGAAASGLHTVGSILSTPSRVLWGGVNGLMGGEGGFGNMNPFDSTGGIELSHVLGNAGVIAKNDPHAWELMPGVGSDGKVNLGDLGRGLVDIAGDPLSWALPLGLTKAGQLAAKSGTLAPGLVNSIRKGHRAAISFQNPLTMKAIGGIGTGHGVANVVEGLGNAVRAPQIANAIKMSAPVRNLRAAFDPAMRGKIHPSIQKFARQHFEEERAGANAIQKDLSAMWIKQNNAKLHNREAVRDMAEDLLPAHPHVQEMQRMNDASHEGLTALGVKTGKLEDDVRHFPRGMSKGLGCS